MKTQNSLEKFLWMAFLTGLMLFPCTSRSVLNAQEDARGDINGDLAITSLDAAMVLQIVNGSYNPTDVQSTTADADQDGEVTGEDAEIILQCAAEKCTGINQVTVGPEGGTIAAGSLTVTFPPGTFTSSNTIIVKQLGDCQVAYSDVSPVSPFYKLENLLQLQGPITIELTFNPQDVLADDSVFMYMQADSFVTAGVGTAEVGYLFDDTSSDYLNGKVSLKIDPLQSEIAGAGRVILPKALNNEGLQQGAAAMVGALAGSVQKVVQDSSFSVTEYVAAKDPNYASSILQHLNDAKKKLENLQFSFKQRTRLINAEITKNVVLGRPAAAVRPWYGTKNYSYIQIKPDIEELKVQVGHELFHIVQWLYDAYGTFKWDYQYVWLTEAASVWFEAKMSDQTDFLSGRITQNENFIHSALETENDAHGYGAAAFLTYLTDTAQYDDELILAIFQEVQKQKDRRNGTLALAQALGGESVLSEEFNEFARVHILGSVNAKASAKLSLHHLVETQSYDVQLAALSAWNCLVENQTGFSPPEHYRMTVALQGGSPNITGAVYTKEAFGTWQKQCEFSPGQSCSIADYGTGDKAAANVILVNKQAEYPYNQNNSVTLTFTFTESEDELPTVDLAKFNYCSIELNKIYAHLESSYDEPWDQYLSLEYCCWGFGKFTGNTFNATWDEETAVSPGGVGEMTISLDNELDLIDFSGANLFDVGSKNMIAGKPGISMEADILESDYLAYWVFTSSVCDYIDMDSFEYYVGDALSWKQVTDFTCDSETELIIECSVEEQQQ